MGCCWCCCCCCYSVSSRWQHELLEMLLCNIRNNSITRKKYFCWVTSVDWDLIGITDTKESEEKKNTMGGCSCWLIIFLTIQVLLSLNCSENSSLSPLPSKELIGNLARKSSSHKKSIGHWQLRVRNDRNTKKPFSKHLLGMNKYQEDSFFGIRVYERDSVVGNTQKVLVT